MVSFLGLIAVELWRRVTGAIVAQELHLTPIGLLVKIRHLHLSRVCQYIL